ncbi:6-phosphogluconate dehydrogenase, decarboxylating [hydrothermal vent metagenome]|uniref:6-phosphogluconate dehydrogenase, decarboxylating n=1 Tax=hydrothermal vent metagenome TaxID=652676 RepID=A0A3B0Z3V8_9ZZZZ
MQLGMIGLGRMGANMVRRLLKDGHQCVAYDHSQKPVKELVSEGAVGSENLDDFLSKLDSPRVVWLMIPAAFVEQQIDELASRLDAGDIIIDGGNSYYKDDIIRARRLQEQGIHYLDVGTSGGVWGLERGYCLMIGGDDSAVKHLDTVFATLAPGTGDIERTAGREGERRAAEKGYLHCGPAGAGHFVKMVHNGIEYGLMAAYAEGFNILKHAGIGKQSQDVDAETSPLRNPEEYQYDINLPDVAELWRRGSVVSSWLLDLTANALSDDAELGDFSGQVSDSGEGRWTSIAAIEVGAPAPLLTAALYSRFSSRGEADFADKILSAMRFQFGGHHEKGKG